MKLYDITNWCRQGTSIEDYPYIGEIDAIFNIGEVVKIGADYYAPGVLAGDKAYAGVRKIRIETNPSNKDFKNNLTCPYCGYEDEDSWELSDNEDEHECGRCGAIISYERVVTVEYNSSPKEPPKVVNAHWV